MSVVHQGTFNLVAGNGNQLIYQCLPTGLRVMLTIRKSTPAPLTVQFIPGVPNVAVQMAAQELSRTFRLEAVTHVYISTATLPLSGFYWVTPL